MVHPVKLYSHLMWKGFVRLTEEPSQETTKNTTSRLIALVCYMVSTLVAVYVTYQAVIFAGDIQSVDVSDVILLPDIVFCPRPGLAGVVMTEAPSENTTLENPGDYRRRYVRWLDKDAWVHRQRAHESYDNNVWYNIKMLDMLRMTKQHVNQFTNDVKSDPKFEAELAPAIRPYMKKLRELTEASFEHDLKELASNNRFDNQKQWQLPIHPRLQELVAMAPNDEDDTRLLWWAIIKTQYVMKYSEQDNQTQNYVKNARFNCFGTKDCQLGFSALWLDNYYCITWKPIRSNFVALYQPDFFDEIQMWTGNTKVQHILWRDFMTPTVEMRTGWFNSNKKDLAVQGLYVTLRALRTETTSNKRKISPICQATINQDQNSPDFRAQYCDQSDAKLDDYIMYMRQGTLGLHYHYVVSVPKTTKYSSAPQFSDWQLFSIIGGTFGLICGLSVIQLMQLLLIKFRQKVQLALQIVIGAALFAVAVYFTVKDVIESLDPENRYIRSPYVIQPEDTPIPTISVRGYTYWSQLTLNHTKLAEYQVSPQLLRYLCVAATGKLCGSDNKIHGRDPFQHRERFLKFWDHPYEQLFVTIRPNDTLMKLIEQEYSALARKFDYDVIVEPAYSVFKQFLLDPCAIVLECQLGNLEPWKCCSEFKIRPHAEDLVIYSLYWSNPNDLKFSEGSFAVYMNASQYELHSDGLAPYLGPDFIVNDAITTEGVKWKHNNIAYISFRTKEGGANGKNKEIKFAGYVSTHLKSGNQFKAVLRAQPDKLLTKEEYEESTCVKDLKCKFGGSADTYVRYRAIEQRCACQLLYSDSFMISLNTTKKYCNAEQAVSCFMNDEFFSGYCHFRPDLGDFKVPSFDWNSNDTKSYQMVSPNVLFFAYAWNYACGWTQLWQNEGSPLGDTVTAADLKTCTEPRACTLYNFVKVPGVTKWTADTHDASKGFKIIVTLYESVEPGQEQRDTFDYPQTVAFALNSFGLFFGLSLIAFMHIVHLIVDKCRSQSVEKNLSKSVQQHWKRSLGFIRAAKAAEHHGSVAPSQNSVIGSMYEEEVEEAPNMSHVFMTCTSTVIFIILVGIFINTLPNTMSNSLSSYNIRFNETDIEPSIALCMKTEPDNSITKELQKLTGCSYRDQSMPCTELFPLMWRPNFPEQNGIVACAVSNQLLHHSENSVPIDLNEAIYKVNNPQNAGFERVWVGELSTLYTTSPDKPMLFYGLSTGSKRTRLTFMTKIYNRIGDCSINSFPTLNKCSEVNTVTSENQLCLVDPDTAKKLPTDIDECTAVEYESTVLNENSGILSLFAGSSMDSQSSQTDRSFEVSYGDYVWLDIRQRQLYNWALQITILGGYIDQMIGLSLLNVIFVFVWFLLGNIILKCKTMIVGALVVKQEAVKNTVVQVQPLAIQTLH